MTCPTSGAVLAAQGGQLAQQLLLLGVQPGRRLHLDVHDELAAAGTAQVLHAEAAQRQDCPDWVPGRMSTVLVPSSVSSVERACPAPPRSSAR